VGAFMCSYNAVNGVPTCANSYLLQTVLREHWGWTNEEQWVTSDCVRKLAVQISDLSMSKLCPYPSANCMASRQGISRDFRLRTGLREPLCLLYSWLNPLFCVSNLSKSSTTQLVFRPQILGGFRSGSVL
jgi:hypothetical protein